VGKKSKTKTILTFGATIFCEMGRERLPLLIYVTEGSCQKTAWEQPLQLKWIFPFNVNLFVGNIFRRNEEQVEARECLLSFGAELFVFQFAI